MPAPRLRLCSTACKTNHLPQLVFISKVNLCQTRNNWILTILCSTVSSSVCLISSHFAHLDLGCWGSSLSRDQTRPDQTLFSPAILPPTPLGGPQGNSRPTGRVSSHTDMPGTLLQEGIQLCPDQTLNHLSWLHHLDPTHPQRFCP